MTPLFVALDGPLKGRGIQIPEGAEVVEVRQNARGTIICVPRPASTLGQVIGTYHADPKGAVWEPK